MRLLISATDLRPTDIALIAFIADQQISLAETEIDASFDREFLEPVLDGQDLAVVEWKQKGMYVSVLDGVVIFVFGEHDTWIASESSVFVGLDV